MKNYPDGLNRSRTEAKLAAMVRELTRRLAASGPLTITPKARAMPSKARYLPK
jgi:hypothetical protein